MTMYQVAIAVLVELTHFNGGSSAEVTVGDRTTKYNWQFGNHWESDETHAGCDATTDAILNQAVKSARGT